MIRFWQLGILFLVILLVGLNIFSGTHSQSADSFRFVGEKQTTCPVGYTQTNISEHIGRNFIRTCVQNNDGDSVNDDRVIAVGSSVSVCPAGYTQKYSSEHIGLNFVRTCSKVDPAPAIALGEKETICPANYNLTDTSEHIGLNNLRTCQRNQISVSLSANPNSGPAPLNNVDLTATVSNAGAGSITYKFYCKEPYGTPDLTITTPTNPYAAVDLCDYPINGTYTAKVEATQGDTVSATAVITVSKPPKIKEIIP